MPPARQLESAAPAMVWSRDRQKRQSRKPGTVRPGQEAALKTFDFRAPAAGLVVAVALAGCGGGSGNSGIITPATVNLPQAFAAWQAASHTVNFTVSGDCTGTASWTWGAPFSAVFESQPAIAVQQTRVRTLSSGCSATSGQQLRTLFFDSGYDQLGVDIGGGGLYGVANAPITLPDLNITAQGLDITPGAQWTIATDIMPATATQAASTTTTISGVAGTMALWSDTSKTVSLGTLTDTVTASMTGQASAASIVVVKQQRDTTGTVIETETYTWQLGLAGVASLQSVDMVLGSTSQPGLHLLFTAD